MKPGYLMAWLTLASVMVAGQNAADTNSTRTKSNLTLAARVDSYLLPNVRGNNFAGAVLVANDGKIEFEKAYGLANVELGVPNTLRTRFHIASVSKPFTAAAILLLAQQGRLSVNDPLSKYVSDYANGDKITIHHLLTHTSGIRNVNNFPEYNEKSRQHLTLLQIIELFKNKPLEFTPGEKYSYSNSNYNLLAYIIEKVSGKGYGEFVQEHLLRPAGMSESGNDSDSADLIPQRASGYVPAGFDGVQNAPSIEWSIKTGNGSLYSTVGDLLRWYQAITSDRILQKAERGKMFTDYGHQFGYGWFIRKRLGRNTIAINGRSPGFTSSLEHFVEDDVTVIMVANTYSGITQSLATDIAAIVFGEQRTPPIKTGKPALADNYFGRYRFGQDFTYNPGAEVTIEKDKRGYALMRTGDQESYLISWQDGTFVDRLFGGEVSFSKAPDSGATQLNWNFGTTYAAKKVE